MAVYFSVRTQYAHVRLLKISYRILGKQATATPTAYRPPVEVPLLTLQAKGSKAR